MRTRIKILKIPANYNETETENAINAALTSGWEFVQVITIGQNFYVFLRKQVTG